jgi:hypothetical protein
MDRMRRFLLVLGSLVALNAVALVSAPGCGNTVVEIKNNDGGGGSGGNDTTTTSGGNVLDAGGDAKDALPDYVDPGCGAPSEPIKDFQCDPYDQKNGDCFEGEGCYIYVQYPSEPCGEEVYGAYCAPVGFGKQGDACGGGTDCGAGLVCVITGFGTQCVELCPLSGNSGCSDGLTCEAIDVEGFGGCF